MGREVHLVSGWATSRLHTAKVVPVAPFAYPTAEFKVYLPALSHKWPSGRLAWVQMPAQSHALKDL